MDTGTMLRLALAVVLAIGGLFLATRAHFEVSSETVGLLVSVGAALWGYRTVAAFFGRRDGT